MDLKRFTDLTETYGGRLARWPEPERAGTHALLANEARAADILRDGDWLDALLDDWRVEPAGAELRTAVLASAPAKTGLRPRRVAWMSDVRLWFAGAGLAAGLAGVFCGVVLSTAALGEQRDEALVASAVSDTAVAAPAQT